MRCLEPRVVHHPLDRQILPLTMTTTGPGQLTSTALWNTSSAQSPIPERVYVAGACVGMLSFLQGPVSGPVHDLDSGCLHSALKTTSLHAPR